MAGGLLGRLADNRHVQASADDARDVLERHALVSDAVVPGSRRTLLNHQPVKMGSIEPVHRGPAVLAVTHICRNALFARDGDETRDKAVVAVAMHRGREAHHRHAYAPRRYLKQSIFRLPGKIGIGSIVFGCNWALTLKEQGPGSDDHRAARTGESVSQRRDGAPVRFGGSRV